MKYAISTVAAAPVRKEAAHRSELVNQLLFGETMRVLEIKEEWLRVQSIYDDYEGWLTFHLVSEVDEETALRPLEYVAISILNVVQSPAGLTEVTIGSHLTGYHPQKEYLWNEKYEYLGSVKNIKGAFNGSSIIRSAMEWMNAPYMWGGKTIFGVDCSGFVQTVYKLFGVRLKRDAWQQAEQGKPVKDLSGSKEGDLAFFQNDQGRITHVGIVMENQKIIHAAGRVRIDRLTTDGIMNDELGRRTHSLHSIRRVLV